MIRAAFALIVAATMAGVLGWLGQAGYPPLVIVQEGQQIAVRGPGERAVVYDEPGVIAVRAPLLSRSTVLDTRLRVSEVTGVSLGQGDDALDLKLWWRIADAARFVDAWPEGPAPDQAIAPLLFERFAERLTAVDFASARVGGGSLEQQLLAVAKGPLNDRGVELFALRVALRPGATQFAAMRSERERLRDALRREAVEIGPRLQAGARREAAQIESEALRQAAIARGQAEAEAARIYADAHGQAPEFFAFSRRLEAYRKTLGPDTTLVLPPDHGFFRLLSPTPEPNAAP